MVAGLAVWCASGTLTVLTADSAQVRVTLPAPLWIGVLATLAAWLVGPWRRRPVTSLPATLSILPWLPVPVPDAVLIWTGTLAWIPIGLALLVAAISGLNRNEPQAGATDRSNQGFPALVSLTAGLLTIAAGALVLTFLGPRLPGGDEPHYLIIAQSLLDDGDVRIGNQHDEQAYASWWSGPLPPHYIERGRDGDIYSIHAPGVAALVAPLFALSGVAGAQLTILAFAGLTGALTWLLGFMSTGSRPSAWFAWAAVTGSTTMLVQSVTIFPDGPGAAFSAGAATIWLARRQQRLAGRFWLGFGSTLLAILPFLHTRFVVVSVILGAVFLADVVRDTRERGRQLAAFLGPAVLGAIAWFGYFQAIYGVPDPTAPYGPNSESSPAYVPGGVLGLLVDQQFGLVTFSPVLLLALVGWWRERQMDRRSALPLLPVVACYLAAVATYWMWWAGVPATPARFATAIVPLLAPALAVAWSRGSDFVRSIALILLAVTIAVAAFVVGSGGDLTWATRGGRAAWLDALGSTADLPRALPSFFWQVIGGQVHTEVPFAVHAIAMVAIVGVTIALAARACRRMSPATTAAMTAIAAAFALMLTATAGWRLNDVSGLEPAASQLRVLRALGDGRRAWTVGPASLAPLDPSRPAIAVTLPRRDLPTSSQAVWAALHDVPAGRYVLRLTSSRPAGGHLAVTLGTNGLPIVSDTLGNLSRHVVPLDLPVGLAALHVEADGNLLTADTRIDLLPAALTPGPFRAARSVATSAGMSLFQLDANTFIEDGAYWVRGGTSAGVVFAPASGTGSMQLALVSGPDQNQVSIRTDEASWSWTMAAGERRLVDLPVTAAGTAFLEVTSSRGFTPADHGDSPDRRSLGVRVEFNPAAGMPPGGLAVSDDDQ